MAGKRVPVSEPRPILLGVCGSISAYKAVELMRRLQKDGHPVSVVLTRNAARLVTPLTFATFAPGRVFSDMWADAQDPLLHIRLGQSHDLLLVAPATANMLAKMAHGLADDLLSTLALAFPGPVAVAPAMNSRMFEHPATQDNLALLRRRGVTVIEPEAGSLACAEEGRGRLPAPEAIIRCIAERLRV